MSEIPMPEPGGYEPTPTVKKRGCCSRTVLCIGVIAIVVIGAIVITAILSGLGPSNGGPSYETRQIESYTNENPDIYPTYYRSEFSVHSYEAETSIQPDLYFEIVIDSGSDAVTTHIAVYDLDQNTFDGISTWEEADTYLMDENDLSGNVYEWIDLYNYANTYTWVLWFECSDKTGTWDIDITLTLRYNWVE
jgi:hypothetical protein